MDLEQWVDTHLSGLILIFVLSFFIYTLRIFKGPTLSDRVIAIDALGYDLVVFIAALTILLRSPIMMIIGFVLALWIYALDIYVAKYLEASELGE